MTCSDNYQTPRGILTPLLPYLNPKDIIWECAAGDGNLVKELYHNYFAVLATDIQTGTDFLTSEPYFPYDLILTNPPYSLMNEFLERCYELQKPFALLMPVRALDTKRRQASYQKFGIELLMLPGQIDFYEKDTRKLARFVCAWFCWQVLPQPIVFVEETPASSVS